MWIVVIFVWIVAYPIAESYILALGNLKGQISAPFAIMPKRVSRLSLAAKMAGHWLEPETNVMAAFNKMKLERKPFCRMFNDIPYKVKQSRQMGCYSSS